MTIKTTILITTLALVAGSSVKADSYTDALLAEQQANIARSRQILEEMNFRQQQQQEAIEYQQEREYQEAARRERAAFYSDLFQMLNN